MIASGKEDLGLSLSLASFSQSHQGQRSLKLNGYSLPSTNNHRKLPWMTDAFSPLGRHPCSLSGEKLLRISHKSPLVDSGFHTIRSAQVDLAAEIQKTATHARHQAIKFQALTISCDFCCMQTTGTPTRATWEPRPSSGEST